MLPNKGLVVCLLLPLILASDAEHYDIQDISKTLDELLVDVRSSRQPRNREDTDLPLIWQKYEFGSGAGNREEVVVTNISSHRYTDIPEINNKGQFLQSKNAYFIRAEHSTLLLHEINLGDSSVERSTSVTTEGRILLFKVLDLNVEETKREDRTDDLMAVLLVESEHGYFLYWYRISGNDNLLYSKLSVQHEFQDMEIVRGENQNELLLLNKNVAYPERSSIDVYGFNFNHSNRRIDIWFCRRLYVPETSDVQVCPIYGNTVLALRTNDSVVLYASRSEDKHCKYEKLEVIESRELANFVCFESGYIEYLAIAGRETHLFHFFEDEFQDNIEKDLLHDGTTKVSWVTAMPLNTYREESLLLMQFENSTVIALAWQGSNFKEVPLPNRIMDDFDLSRIVVVPKVGFMYRNTFVRLDVILRELAHPTHIETESMLKTRVLLEEVFRGQEAVFDETEARLNRSHLRNPVTGFWNLSTVEVTNVTLEKDVKYGAIKVGTIDLQLEDISTNVTSSLKKLEELEASLERVLPDSEDMADVFTMKIVLSPDVKLEGDFLVNGTLRAKNVTAAFVNNASTSAAADDGANRQVDFIHGRKSFPSVDSNDLTAVTLNGIPLEEYVFDASIRNHEDVDFSRLKRLEINGHLNFSEINDVDWGKLMRNIVWKDKMSEIPGDTIVKGQIIADSGSVTHLNDLQYPKDYVPARSNIAVNVTGEKYFSNLSVRHFVNVSKINDIDIDDFIILSRHEILDREITFENLRIDGVLQVDGNITGINATKVEDSLTETDTIKTDVIFENLIVEGNIVLRNSIDAKTWSELDDFLLKTEENAVITGNKRFLTGVILKSKIKTERINGHKPSEFVNLDADQQFPYLKRISANVTFGDVKLGAINKLEDYIISEQNVSAGCMNKVLFFRRTPIVDKISFETIGQSITKKAFFVQLNETFDKVYFDNLTLSTLTANEITPNTINGIWNYTDLMKHVLTTSRRQNLTGSLVVDNLEVGVLHADLVNGMPIRDFNQSLTRAGSLYDGVLNGNATLESLRVTGVLEASSINGRDILDIYDERSMEPVIFQRDVTIENLTVFGSVNGRNLSEFVDDAVRKTDRNVTFTGNKTFRNVTCEFLDAIFVNGHSVNDILDPDREQVLRGPIVVDGSIIVLRSFNTTGRVGDMFLSDFTDRFKPFGNNYYDLRGDVRFTEDVSVEILDVSGPIQGSMFDNFLQRTIAKNESNVMISGQKLFNTTITFNDRFTITDKLDDLELFEFREKAVYVDKPFSISSKVTFKENIHVRKNLLVKKQLQASTIMGVNVKDLQENVVLLNSPTHFGERMTLDNVTFQASVKVVQVNDLKMDELIPLHTDQLIMVEVLKCTNVSYKNIELYRRINYHNLNDIYTDTFTIHDDQNITGTIKIQGNVYAYSDFNAHSINDFKPSQIISINTDDILFGNFEFKNAIILNNSLRILGLLNGIDPVTWQGTAVMKTGKIKQTVFGKWRIHGNVTFEKNVNGNEFLNGVNITEASVTSRKERAKLDPVVEKTNENLNNVCETLNTLKCVSVNQIYKFDTFDYLKILEFEGNIHDIYNIDSGDLEYLLVNHGDCSVTLLQYTSTSFVKVDKVTDVGLIDQWVFYKLDRTMYVLTVAKRACDRSFNNIWKLEDNRLTHVLELGNVTNFIRAYQDTIVAMTHGNSATVPESNLQSNILKALASYEEDSLSSILYNDSITPVNQTSIHELQGISILDLPLSDCLNCSSQLNFRVGIYKREEYVYYNEEISQNHIYFWKNDGWQTRILQIIKAHRPKSFLILNFKGLVETLLIFIENNEAIRIYEYRGIEGFVYKNSIKMKVDKLYKFKMRKYMYMEKRHYLAAVSGDRLTILEAKMHGEKLDLTALTSTGSCTLNACPTR